MRGAAGSLGLVTESPPAGGRRIGRGGAEGGAWERAGPQGAKSPQGRLQGASAGADVVVCWDAPPGLAREPASSLGPSGTGAGHRMLEGYRRLGLREYWFGVLEIIPEDY